MTAVAFLGLGHMGFPMAAHLAAAGHTVVGFDPALARDAGPLSVVMAASASEAVAEAHVVITMLQSGAQVIGVYTEVLGAAPESSLFIDSSTIDVESSLRAHALAEAAGHRSIDAPVSGGVVGAEAATLAFMVGGREADFAAAEPLLALMGKRVVHCGGAGLGQAAKICNNLILGVSMIGVSEAFVLGERLGLTHQALFDVASNASGQCWALTTNCPVPGPVASSPANHGYEPGFAAALMAKDLGLAEAALEATGTEASMGLLAASLFREFATAGGASRDFSAIIDDIRLRGPVTAPGKEPE